MLEKTVETLMGAVSANTIPGLMWGHVFDTAGKSERYPVSAIFDPAEINDGFAWLHLDLVDNRARHWFEALTFVPSEAKIVFLNMEAHARLEPCEDSVAGVIADHIAVRDAARETQCSVHFVKGENWLITGRRQPSPAALAVHQKVDGGLKVSNPAVLLESIVEAVIASIGDDVRELSQELDDVEDHLLDQRYRGEDVAIGKMRRRAVNFHRELLGQRVTFRRFAQWSEEQDLEPETVSWAARIIQRIDTLHGDVHVIQERAKLLQEEISAGVAAEINKSLYVLSIISALMLPPTLLFGLFGINVGGLPFLNNAYGFWIVVIGGALSAFVIYWLLIRRPRE